MTKHRHYYIYILFIFLHMVTTTHAEESTYTDAEAKAGYIYKFILYVTWPKEEVPKDTFTIGILGQHSFGTIFNEIEGNKIHNRTIVIKYLPATIDYKTLDQCQLLFIPNSQSKKIPLILKATHKKPILTVSENKGFIDQGGHIGLIKIKNKIHFETNNSTAKQSKLKLSAQFNRNAHRVSNKKPKKEITTSPKKEPE